MDSSVFYWFVFVSVENLTLELKSLQIMAEDFVKQESKLLYLLFENLTD